MIRKLRLYSILSEIYETITGLIFISFICCCVIQIISRYILHISIPWTEELARYCLVVYTMLGAVIVTRNGGHLGAYFLRDRASGRVKAVILIVSIIVEISFMITVLVGSLVMIPILENTKAITMRWFRMDFLYWVVITASLLMVIVFLKDLVLAVQRLISGKTDDLVSEVSRPMIKKN